MKKVLTSIPSQECTQFAKSLGIKFHCLGGKSYSELMTMLKMNLWPGIKAENTISLSYETQKGEKETLVSHWQM